MRDDLVTSIEQSKPHSWNGRLGRFLRWRNGILKKENLLDKPWRLAIKALGWCAYTLLLGGIGFSVRRGIISHESAGWLAAFAVAGAVSGIGWTGFYVFIFGWEHFFLRFGRACVYFPLMPFVRLIDLWVSRHQDDPLFTATDADARARQEAAFLSRDIRTLKQWIQTQLAYMPRNKPTGVYRSSDVQERRAALSRALDRLKSSEEATERAETLRAQAQRDLRDATDALRVIFRDGSTSEERDTTRSDVAKLRLSDSIATEHAEDAEQEAERCLDEKLAIPSRKRGRCRSRIG